MRYRCWDAFCFPWVGCTGYVLCGKMLSKYILKVYQRKDAVNTIVVCWRFCVTQNAMSIVSKQNKRGASYLVIKTGKNCKEMLALDERWKLYRPVCKVILKDHLTRDVFSMESPNARGEHNMQHSVPTEERTYWKDSSVWQVQTGR